MGEIADLYSATGADETASEIVNRHIRYLHRYNEMRDSGLGMLSLLAENKGLTLAQIYKERGMNETVELWFPG
ncbi:hypothetical protein N7468_004990 [Penicillium chermesinum]|uniref:Uncharacterized protein n=1 Tax=Penicillium chermesinum TaxID=63820 RepID=A0A9W9NYC5_9EURO|nr:uncharacterized protein N7468_004990 [Penicillium chermesinum]KAJ5232034.1 hypothetical protein N7468_004990 [Penicillium chermesinum]KAJ6171701.1 hypothetical protein N7470_000768 [Penicillium chermesinum]